MCHGLLGGHCGVGPQQWQTAVQKPRQPRMQIEASRKSMGLAGPTRRLNVTKWRQVEINDGFERVGCRVAMEAIGDCCEPLCVLSLQREQ